MSVWGAATMCLQKGKRARIPTGWSCCAARRVMRRKNGIFRPFMHRRSAETGDGHYRLPAGSTFAQYACCDSKLAYLRGIYRRYLIFGAAVYIALAMDMSAFLSMRMTVLHGVALVLLTLLALAFSVGLTRFHVVLRRLRRGAAEERGELVVRCAGKAGADTVAAIPRIAGDGGFCCAMGRMGCCKQIRAGSARLFSSRAGEGHGYSRR